MTSQDFLIDGKWRCNRCGACCSYIRPIVDAGKLSSNLLDGDGCKNLVFKKNKAACKVYWHRPKGCKVDRSMGDDKLAEWCATMYKGVFGESKTVHNS